MKVLVVGSGGREHALVWKLKQSPKVTSIACAPGNAGIGRIADLVPIPADDVDGLYQYAKINRIDLTVIGPEVPLVKGIVDLFEKNGLRVFGPSKFAAQLEGSKVFAKNFLRKYKIPTAGYATFERSQFEEAQRHIMEHDAPLVVKADGLAAGKGAVVCRSTGEALNTLEELFRKNIFGDAGRNIVVEEFMEGEEASVFVLTDGSDYRLLQPAQDHKQILDGDKGKNTGGMGAYAPAPVVTPSLMKRVEKEIIRPTLEGMKKEGKPYKGCLYVGLMMTPQGPKVVEFNCRLGDPETQVVLPLLESDLFELLEACASGTLASVKIKHHKASAVCVVVASRGYPDTYETGKEISGLDGIGEESGVVVFHAGTKSRDGKIVSAGGRVLGVTAFGYGDDLEGTINAAYGAVKKISFDGAYYRSDIGRKALAR
ncbi:MAG TPA: phosphoribosylamine--glycine ligase [Bacteroidota bacterium]|nr:phosphoribosylamine--glycine ligase [Bacteroidota bacterium]